jgi:hypothetical protein
MRDSQIEMNVANFGFTFIAFCRDFFGYLFYNSPKITGYLILALRRKSGLA